MVAGLAIIVDNAQTALAPLHTVGGRVGVVELEAETCTRHQRLVLRDLPIQTSIETVVVVLGVRVTRLVEGIDRRRSLVPLLEARVVHRICIVEEVATLEGHLLALAPDARIVQAQSIYRCNTSLRTNHILANATTAAATARRTENILEREVLLVDIIEQTQCRYTVVAVEDIDVTACQILMLCDCIFVVVVAITCIELTKLTLTHMLVSHNVQRLVAFAVVHTRELGLIAQLVIHLDAINRLCGQ